MNPSLAALLFWISVVVCTIAELAIVAATARASRRSTADAARATLDLPQVDGARPLPRPRRWLELFYVAAPAIGLAVLFVFTWRAMHVASDDSNSRSPSAGNAVAGAVSER